MEGHAHQNQQFACFTPGFLEISWVCNAWTLWAVGLFHSLSC